MAEFSFTRRDNSVRVWFPIHKNGKLRKLIPPGEITATVVAPDDDASGAFTVIESTELPGGYYFDVPSSFFTDNGVSPSARDYAIFVVVAATAPPLNAVMGGRLPVFIDDFDSLAAGGLGTERVIIGVAYDFSSDELRFNAALLRNGMQVTAVDDAKIEVYSGDDTLLFAAITDDAADAQGVFRFTKNGAGLAKNNVYTVIATINHPGGTVVTTTGFKTLV